MGVRKTNSILNVIGLYRNESKHVISSEEVSQYVHSVQLLEDILKFSKTCFFIVEYSNLGYLYCSPNVEEVLGYESEDYLKGGPMFTLSKMPDKHLDVHQQIHERIIDIFVRLPDEEKLRTKFSFTIQLDNKEGRTLNILQNNFFLKWSEDGRPLVKLFTLTDISAYKTSDDFIFFAVRLLKDGTQEILEQEYVSRKMNAALTKRELEVLQLSASGYSNKEISQVKLLKENTVKNHKKNIRKKLGCRNNTQMVSLGTRYGLVPATALLPNKRT